ncbi:MULTISPECIES: hypothetical protein [Chryseobacterium]|uniref:Uncharacterized protein n=1 Tax=Chryseobacterium koreense CCUG 49689 TaxID=1304281 RepID=A0A0J7LMK7_9FLAO|nr:MULTISPECIES: hypothetical protein [Chryseobacterium]KMQ70335.1 hypothetical protein ACM44_13035 [Chryseobacterium koreense CCUG 49689]MBB5334887.1 hypothetical protein [Chryseobacterium koreense]
MSTITKPQIQQLQTICSGKFRNREERLEAISEMMGVEVNSITELNRLQADELIYFFNTGKTLDHSSWALFDKYNTQHKTVLSLCHQLGWVQEANPHFVDLQRLGGWLKSDRSPVKLPLKEMNRTELSKIIFALQNILKSNYK